MYGHVFGHSLEFPHGREGRLLLLLGLCWVLHFRAPLGALLLLLLLLVLLVLLRLRPRLRLRLRLLRLRLLRLRLRLLRLLLLLLLLFCVLFFIAEALLSVDKIPARLESLHRP